MQKGWRKVGKRHLGWPSIWEYQRSIRNAHEDTTLCCIIYVTETDLIFLKKWLLLPPSTDCTNTWIPGSDTNQCKSELGQRVRQNPGKNRIHISSSLQSCSSCRVLKKGSTNFSSSVITGAANGSVRSHFILHFCATNISPTLQELSHHTCKTWAEKSLLPSFPTIVRKICCLTREKFPLLIDS